MKTKKEKRVEALQRFSIMSKHEYTLLASNKSDVKFAAWDAATKAAGGNIITDEGIDIAYAGYVERKKEEKRNLEASLADIKRVPTARVHEHG